MTENQKSQIISKFAGEAFGVDNIRTVFVSAAEDNREREDRVILLIGPAGTGKSTLIDCLCNYFYTFDHTTPVKAIIKYVFNETHLPYRPIVFFFEHYIHKFKEIHTDQRSIVIKFYRKCSYQYAVYFMRF
ncbi:unnamed protein product, partial [Enterobius vermicularis]|uniref:RNA polymerase II-associated factor 1 homolog n=1 Tax=Enterobius vermicularis TaxID=51028 RepID=A0A0N4VRH2_ENTVE